VLSSTSNVLVLNSPLTGWAYKEYADKDAVVVDILRKAGAVLFVKTQNPQSLLVRIMTSLY
jgi:Asp-tRNA(Asn)/Glu-tRNA(Gln) amidotransferase A subunit family amidase